MVDTAESRPTRLLFVQTQAEAAGAQEITRILGEELCRPAGNGIAEFEAHHLFLYRKTSGCDHFPNVHFAADPRPSGPLESVKLLSRLFGLVRRIKPDVLLAFQHYGNIVAAPVGRILGVPLIVANHVSPQSTISRPVAFIDRMMGLAGAYDEITVNSQETWQDYQAHPLRYRRHITYVPHGFADKTAAISSTEARARLQLPQAVALMGAVARLHPIKRLDLAIRLLPHLPDAHLALVGQGPDEARLRDLSRDLGVTDRLHFVGEMPSTEIGTFLASLDVFVFPTSSETFGLAPIEAAQAGIPVICSDLLIMREVLRVEGQPCALFVDAADSRAFAAAVRQVLSDPDLHGRLSALGRQLRGEHSLEAMIEGYRSLIRGRPRARPDLRRPTTQLQN